uniref:Wsv427-like protein n=1 Tax=Trachysalambria curvirostris nimavirus TaxID=2984282 RepID=A0A9C7BN13_9VIRU|nr:MAG: wsv427-like protein [Trachysalambria curvirostris nimavirus]
MASALDRLIDQVKFVHNVTVNEGVLDFVRTINEGERRNGPDGSKRICAGKWIPEKYADIDLVIQNCPEEGGKVATAVLDCLRYWEDVALPSLRGKKFGGESILLKAVSVCVARCCVAEALSPDRRGFEAEKHFLSVREGPVLDLVRACTSFHKGSEGSPPSSPEIGDEAIEEVADAVYKVWSRMFRSASHARNGAKKKFASFSAFVAAWKFASEKYASEPNHEKRDVLLHHVSGRSCSLDAVDDIAEVHADGTLLYPVNTAATTITDDYVFKLLVELVLSPHINVEWKMPMCKFIVKDAGKAVAAFEADICKSAADIVGSTESAMCEYGSRAIMRCRSRYGMKYNPSRLMPRAANFWDFCRGGHSPSKIRFCMLFNEPSCNPKMSSGAGLYAKFTGIDNETLLSAARRLDEERSSEVDTIANSLLALVGVSSQDEAARVSTRRWREEGSVACINFYPWTVAGADLGYGKMKSMSACWLKTVQKSILDAVKRERNIADKKSRTSDLLSDAGNVSITTAVFGCLTDVRALNGLSIFKIKVGFQEPIQSNARGASLLYATARREISYNFPIIV